MILLGLLWLSAVLAGDGINTFNRDNLITIQPAQRGGDEGGGRSSNGRRDIPITVQAQADGTMGHGLRGGDSSGHNGGTEERRSKTAFKHVFPNLDASADDNALLGPGLLWRRSPNAFKCDPGACVKPGTQTPTSIGLHTEVLLEIHGNPDDPKALPDVKCGADESFRLVAEAFGTKFGVPEHVSDIATQLEAVARKHGGAWAEPESTWARRNTEDQVDALQAQFGGFTQALREGVVQGGSEFATGHSIFSLAVAINARRILEIGRWRGFSTLALASALRLLDIGWTEPKSHKQRRDVNYTEFEDQTRPRRLVSVDPFPLQEAKERLQKAGVDSYVEWIDQESREYNPTGEPFDLVFIDGDHTYDGLKRDVDRFVPHVRAGGYFIVHDYFGWYTKSNQNRSPIRKVAHELAASGRYEQVLIDTGYMSFVIFRVRYQGDMAVENLPNPTSPQPDTAPPNALESALTALQLNANPAPTTKEVEALNGEVARLQAQVSELQTELLQVKDAQAQAPAPCGGGAAAGGRRTRHADAWQDLL